MHLTSSAFTMNQPIPSDYTCDGENKNPPLHIDDVPAEAQSLALIMDDPDAPNGDWVHWVVWNMSPDTHQIEPGAPLMAEQGLTNFGKHEYGGPCPPSGVHHYHFKLYALDTRLDLPETTHKKSLLQAMEGHVLDQAQLVGTYSRRS